MNIARLRSGRKALGIGGIVVAAVLLAWLLPELTVSARVALALTLMTVGLWATRLVPEYLAALLFFLLAMLLHVAPASTVFSGFASTAFWLTFGGLVIGVGVRNTSLGQRIARQVASRLESSYLLLLGGVVGLGMLFSFFMPSTMGRVVLLTPVAAAVAEHVGFEPGSDGHCGLVLAAIFGAQISGFTILPANVPNMVLLGSAQTLYGIAPLYAQYLLLHFPVLGLVKSGLLVALLARMFPARTAPSSRARQPAAGAVGRVPLSRGERVLAGVLMAALVLWMTDSLHHISPGWVALGAALVLLWPGIGVVDKDMFRREVDLSILLFIAAVIGLGAVIAKTGLGNHVANVLLAWMPLAHGRPWVDFMALSGLATVTGVVTTLPGIPAVLSPLAAKVAAATGLSVNAVLMTQVLGYSMPLLPYQSPPLLVGLALSGVPVGRVVRLLFILGLLCIVVLWPLDFLWWRLLGWI